MTEINQKLLDFTKKGTSAFHTVEEAKKMLQTAGFIALNRADEWKLSLGGKYYVQDCFGSLVAFCVHTPGKLRIAAGHTEWPSFHIKPNPEMIGSGYIKINAEPYGGAILSTWLDRPLSAAGKVALKGETPFAVKEVLFDFEEPIAVIPNVAIHMNRTVNTGMEYNAAVDMVPLTALLEKDMNADGFFVRAIAEKLGVDEKDILSFDMDLYVMQDGCEVGLKKEMLMAPRLDNLTSCFACMEGLIRGERKEGIDVIVLYDHEEVGNKSKQGADGQLLPFMLEKLALSLGLTREQYLNMLMDGFLLSCDVAHALHPNHPEKYDPKCTALLNSGVTLKLNFTQKHPTDAGAFGSIAQLCEENHIPYRTFMNKSGSPGGGTIGADASSLLSMRAVDVGVPILAMHSAVETMGTKDIQALCDLCAAFFSAE